MLEVNLQSTDVRGRALPGSFVSQYLPLIQAITHLPVSETRRKVTVAFTAASSGEGVSHVVRSLGADLATFTRRRVLIAEAQRLQKLRVTDCPLMPHSCAPTDVDNLWVLPESVSTDLSVRFADVKQQQALRRRDELQHGVNYLTITRDNFDYVLIDCPALNRTADASVLAPLVDGVVVVVKADSTRRDQIRRAQQAVEMADGKLLGYVLNRRRYPIPKWIYRWL